MRDGCDAIVIGAGPAGSAAALLLARQSWRVALIDRAPPSRPKACGHCLSPRVHALLRAHGLLAGVTELASGRTRALRIHVPGRAPLELGLEGDDGPGWLVDRAMFDQYLADRAAAAGAEVLRGTRARVRRDAGGSFVVEAQGPDGRRTLRAPLMVGADGLRSAVAQAAGMDARGSVGRKFGFAFDAPSAPPAEDGVVRMFVGRGGYLGVVPAGEGRVHAAGLVAAGAGRTNDPFAFARSLASVHPELESVVAGACGPQTTGRVLGAGPMPCRAGHVAAGQVALVGDAAGYHEPFTGEGMSWALESAALLADVASSGRIGEWSDLSARHYRHMWRRRIGQRQLVCRALSAALERPRATRLLSDAARGCGPLTRLLTRRVLAA